MNYKDLFIGQSLCKKSTTSSSCGSPYSINFLNANTPKPSTTETEMFKITPKISGAGSLDIAGAVGILTATTTATIRIYENNTLIKTKTVSIDKYTSGFGFFFEFDFKAFNTYSVKTQMGYVKADEAGYTRLEFSGYIVDDENAYFNF